MGTRERDTVNLQGLHVGGGTEACKLPGHWGWLKCTAMSEENQIKYNL